jgi:hypothetical protein
MAIAVLERSVQAGQPRDDPVRPAKLAVQLVAGPACRNSVPLSLR